MSVVDGKKGGKQSRFSTLRVFGKFGKNAPPGPPPPPPKDAVYLAARNRSLASLSPESLPASPLSGEQYAASSSSAVSLSLPQQSKQRSGLFKFNTVSRKATQDSVSVPSPAEDDENISMPWNFQHNVHVDEGFAGMPPSWTTSLQEAGFSDEEIAAMKQRRLADRERERAHSPAALVRPVPRSTSLPKNQQGHTPASSLSASSASMSSSSSSPVPDLPGSQYSSPKIEYASPKVEYQTYNADYASSKPQLDTLRPPPSPKSPPPVYWREEQPQPLNIPKRPPQQHAVYRSESRANSQRSMSPSQSPPPSRSMSPSSSRQPPRSFSPAAPFRPSPQSQVHSRSQSQQSSASAHSDDYDAAPAAYDEPQHSRSRSPSPSQDSPLQNANSNLNLKNLTLDLDLSLGDPASTWSDAVLSATSLKPDFGLDSGKSPSSPLFTLTAPGREEKTLDDDDDESPIAAYYTRQGRESTGSGGSSPGLAYDYNYDERDYASDREESNKLDVTREREQQRDRDSGLSDTTMLAPPPSAGVVSRIAVARRAVAEVVQSKPVPVPVPAVPQPPAEASTSTAAPPPRVGPPASPQSSHFDGSSGSSESHDHQTPTTELAEDEDEDDTGELDYYLEGKSYLEKNGFKVEGSHRERGHGADHGSNHGHSRSNSRKNTDEDEEDEEEKRRQEWEAMQRGELRRTMVDGKIGKAPPAPPRTETPPLRIKTATPPLQLKKTAPLPPPTVPPPSRTPPTPVRTPPAPPQIIRVPVQPDPRSRLMTSTTDTFGLADGPDGDEEVDHDHHEYEYGGYGLPEDRESAIAGAVESPNPGVGGYGSAFGSPSAAPAGYGYAGSSEPRRGEAEEVDVDVEEYEDEDEEEDEEGTLGPKQRAKLGLAIREAAPVRPQVITTRRSSKALLSPGPLTALGMATTPITPAQRYAGWVAAAVAPLEDFIDEPSDPREFYGDLHEIAEGESGSVYAAEILPDAPIQKLRLPPLVKARDADELSKGRRVLVAIKSVALLPGGSQKLLDVQKECSLLQGLRCDQVLGLDALYVDMEEDSLWIRMELMERSLADVVGLVEEGLRLQEPRIVARFANDMLQALDFLQKHNIAHRDLRSDNLLLNAEGFLKLADFSNAVHVTSERQVATDVVGVVFWQAPEVRSGSYDPLKVDVWSVGATVWELAEANPPFSDTQQPADRWPPISNPDLYPPSFHDLLRLCSEPAASRPSPGALLETPFVQKACGRPVIVQLLSRCTAIEQALHAGDELPDSPP